jgi:Cytochrome P450
MHSAVILEGLRLSYGIASRLQRISPDEPLYFRSSVKSEKHESPVDYVIPPGTPVGMTSVLVHHNPDIFPNPLEFMPERWLDASGLRTKGLNGFLLSFSKGTRQCVGIKYVKSFHWTSQLISLYFNLLASALASAVFLICLGVSTNTPPRKNIYKYISLTNFNLHNQPFHLPSQSNWGN